MKIRNRHLLRAAGGLGSLSLRTLFRTLRVETCEPDGPVLPASLPPGNRERHVYAIWHENLLLPTIEYGNESLAVLISKHADGQLLGALIRSMGMHLVEGSTNRGGIGAVRELIHDPNARRHLAITPDGPRGPRRQVQPGVVYVASRAGMSVVCIGVGYHAAWRLKSWDRFAVPKPTSRAKAFVTAPIHVPPGLRGDQLEAYRLRVQAEMERVSGVAEEWARTNRKPVVPPVRAAA